MSALWWLCLCCRTNACSRNGKVFLKCRCIKMPIIMNALLYINRYYNFKLFITVNIFFISFKLNKIIVQSLISHQNLLLYETKE